MLQGKLSGVAVVNEDSRKIRSSLGVYIKSEQNLYLFIYLFFSVATLVH
jgi:hypothetical protein